jgi:hypothetical protein
VKSSTAIPHPALSAERLRSLQPIKRHAGRNHTKADVLVYQYEEGVIAVKDYGPRSFLMRNLLGRYLIRRESRAYTAAGELPGLPRFLGRLGPFSLCLEWIDGKPLAELETQDIPPGSFRRLREITRSLHDRGVALSDLHRRDVLIGAGGEVHVIDLATAFLLGERPGRTRRKLFTRLCDQDRLAIARMEAFFRGGDPEQAVLEAGERAAAWHRRGRLAKRMLDRLRGRRGGE